MNTLDYTKWRNEERAYGSRLTADTHSLRFPFSEQISDRRISCSVGYAHA
jgi:hypothetical protein